MFDPFITPCCDQKQLRYFFEKVDTIGYATFFCQTDYPMWRFLQYMALDCHISEVTLAVRALDSALAEKILGLLNTVNSALDGSGRSSVISHLNLIVPRDAEIPESISGNGKVTLARDLIDYDYMLLHSTYSADMSNRTIEEDTAQLAANLQALQQETAAMAAEVEAGAITPNQREKLESAWIDYLLSSTLKTGSGDRYYTFHGGMPLEGDTVSTTYSVTCIRGKAAYDDVMRVLGSVLRLKKARAQK